MLSTISAPWTATLSPAQHMLIYYFLVAAALALLAGLLRSIITRNEVGARFRTAVVARMGIKAVALASYLILIYKFEIGYDLTAAGYVPNSEAINTIAPRYMEWTVSVPLLCVELLAVCAVVGVTARRTRAIAIGGSFFMIFSGYLGAVVVGGGESIQALVTFGLIACIFWGVVVLVLVRAVRASLEQLTPEAAALLKQATVLLMSGWVVYPLVYVLQIVTDGGAWMTVIQIVLCTADVVVKIGFAGFIHRVAQLRTAEDVRAGDDVHPEAIWISSVKQSDAGLPQVVYLDDSLVAHRRRPQPPQSQAVPSQLPLIADSVDD